MTKKTITPQQAIEIVSAYACPGDYGQETWEEVLDEGLRHVDGLAVALEIDDKYQIIHNQ